jgi:hypothetical protein
MKYLQTEAFMGDNDGSEDAIHSTVKLEMYVEDLENKIASLPADAPMSDRLKLILDRCYGLLELNRFEEAWPLARQALDDAIQAELWLRAVEACDVMFQTEQTDSLKALAHGVWLGVTFPIDPELSVAMLQHIVDESPDRSDGAAVAAATAGYIVNLRATGKQKSDLEFFTIQLLGEVARRHSQVEEQEIFDFWVQQLELDDPAKFLPRLAQVIDVLADGDWWFDRDQLREKIPAE